MSGQSQSLAQQSLKPFFIIWSGQAVSLLGSQLVQFALVWHLTKTTGSATVLAMASLMAFLPQVLLGPFVGVLVDRWSRRWTMLIADTVIALATILLAYLFWVEVIQVWHIFGLLFIRALGGTFHWSAMTASTSLMVPTEHLTRIQGLNQMLYGGLNIVSAPLGALLLELLPMQGILAIDVVTALFAITPLFFIPVPQPQKKKNETTIAPTSAWSSFWGEMGEGFQYLRSWRGLMVLTGLAMIVKIVLNPAFALLPLLITDHFGGEAMQLGILEAVVGIGIVIGGLILGAWGGFERRIFTIMAGLVGLGIGMLVLGFAPSSLFVMGVAGGALIGLTLPFVDGPLMAILQATIEPELQGRVMTLFGSLVSSTVPIGLVIAGPVADLVGVRPWFIAAGGLTIVMAVVGLFIPSLLGIEDGRSAPLTEPVIGIEMNEMETAVSATV